MARRARRRARRRPGRRAARASCCAARARASAATATARSSSPTAAASRSGARSPPTAIVVSELAPVGQSLEEVFFELTEGAEARRVSRAIASELLKLRTTRTFLGARGQRRAAASRGVAALAAALATYEPGTPPGEDLVGVACFAHAVRARARPAGRHDRVPPRHDHADAAGGAEPRAADRREGRRARAGRLRARPRRGRRRPLAGRGDPRRCAASRAARRSATRLRWAPA